MAYQPKSARFGKTPEARAAQLANLNRGRKRGRPRKTRPSLKGLDIVEFATDVLHVSFDERPAQEVVLRSLYGLPLSPEQLDIYRQLTGNEQEFEGGTEKTEGVWAVGARGGKSFLSSIVALYEAIVRGDKWKRYLQPGETGYAVLIATRQTQSEQIIQANCARLLENSEAAYMIKSTWQAELELRNGLRIASFPCNSTAARGLPIFTLILDEIAHFRVEGVKADETIYNALRPRQAQFPGAKCLKISTPAAKQGLLWDEFSDGFQVPSRLTISAPTRTMNPVIPQEFIDKEYARDPDNASREFGAEFAETVSGFFASCIDKLRACFVLAGDQPYNSQFRYFAGIDQSGLSGRDRFAFAAGHNVTSGKPRTVIDVCRTWDTRDGDVILGEIKALTSEYKIPQVSVDKYGAGWVRQALEKLGLEVIVRPPLPVVYANLKSQALSGHLLLPDRKDLRSGLTQTQAFYSRSNNLSIGHERTREGHGDIADAVASCVHQCCQAKAAIKAGIIIIDLNDDDLDDDEHLWSDAGQMMGW